MYICYWLLNGQSPHGVVGNVLDCDIVVREFELQSRYYIHNRVYTYGEDMNNFIPPVIGWITSQMSFKDC